MEKSNFTFLDGILFVLGSRKKHPWGESLGFKNARISSIFKGIPPTADALEVIARAENVNINWLLSGEGHPFYTHNWYTDVQAVELYTSPEKLQFIFTDGTGRATLISRADEKFEYGDTEANYKKSYVVPNVNLESLLENRTDRGDLLLITLDSKTLNEVNLGELGPVHLFFNLFIDGNLTNDNDRVSCDNLNKILDTVGRFNISKHDEATLLNAFKLLDHPKRNAMLTIVGALSNPHNVNVNQAPPSNIVNPDSNTKSQTVSVHEEPAPAYEIHSDD